MMVGMMAYRPVQALMGYRDGEALLCSVYVVREFVPVCFVQLHIIKLLVTYISL